MKGNERMILVGLAVVGLMVGFYLLVLSPKRHQASDLQGQVDDLQSSLSQAQQEAAAAESAKRSFGIDYRRLVVLGKAVPADSEQTSLLVQLQQIADRSSVQFQSFDLSSNSSGTTSTPSTASTSTSASSSDASSSTDSSSTSSPTTTASATPSEAAVSTLPIGASVGPAGLPVMPYTLDFKGGFFQMAEFMQRLDSMVGLKGNGLVDVKGRLLTVDGFHLAVAAPGSPDAGSLTAELDVTSFLTPVDQGITAGATPSGPAAATPTPVSSSATTPDSTSTSTDATSTTGSTTPTTGSTTASSASVPTSTSP